MRLARQGLSTTAIRKMERFLWPTEKRSVAHPPPGPWGLILTTGAFNNDELLHYRCSFLRPPRYRIHSTQYKTVQSWLVFKHVSAVQCSSSSFIQIQYKTKQFLYPKFSSVQYSTASRIRYIVSTVQNSIDICFVLHWYYKIQSSKSFIGVTLPVPSRHFPLLIHPCPN